MYGSILKVIDEHVKKEKGSVDSYDHFRKNYEKFNEDFKPNNNKEMDRKNMFGPPLKTY